MSKYEPSDAWMFSVAFTLILVISLIITILVGML